jgi:hypothetical protein
MGPWRTESAYVDQVPRRMAYEAAHPHVTITYHRTYWQAVIREQDGETVVSRYELKALLDKLESLDPPESVKAQTTLPALADEIRQAHEEAAGRAARAGQPRAGTGAGEPAMSEQRRGVFDVDEDHALALVWADEYDETWVHRRRVRRAHHKDAGKDEVLPAAPRTKTHRARQHSPQVDRDRLIRS